MNREKSTIDIIYDGVDSNDVEISRFINCLSSYFEKYNKEFKYTSRYLKSFTDDFENALYNNSLFEELCIELVKEISHDKTLSNFLDTAKAYLGELYFSILLNDAYVIRLSVKSDRLLSYNRVDVLDKVMWVDKSSTIKKFNCTFEFTYDGNKYTDFYYSIDYCDLVVIVKQFLDKIMMQIIVKYNIGTILDTLSDLGINNLCSSDVVIDFYGRFKMNANNFDKLEHLVSTDALVFSSGNVSNLISVEYIHNEKKRIVQINNSIESLNKLIQLLREI